MADVTRPSPGRLRRLAALAQARNDWEDKHLEGAPFRPQGRKQGSDYNQHHLDVDASPDVEAEFAAKAKQIMSAHRQGTPERR